MKSRLQRNEKDGTRRATERDVEIAAATVPDTIIATIIVTVGILPDQENEEVITATTSQGIAMKMDTDISDRAATLWITMTRTKLISANTGVQARTTKMN